MCLEVDCVTVVPWDIISIPIKCVQNARRIAFIAQVHRNVASARPVITTTTDSAKDARCKAAQYAGLTEHA